ncbi:MAG: helix-turn-helix domain-containing protein [Ignavibacteriaceae bacterium]
MNHIKVPAISQEAINLLKEYPWPGNIRELKNTIETAMALNKNGRLDILSFSVLLNENNSESTQRNLPVYLKKSPEEVDRELLYRALFEIKKDILELKDLIYHNQNEIYTQTSNNIDDVVPLDELEKEAIKNALSYTRGNKRDAAKMLKISERTLYRKIKEYEL